MDRVEDFFTLTCKNCGKLQDGRYFAMGADHRLCAECDPKILTCKKCKHTKLTSRFSKDTRMTGANLCYNCEKGYTYVKKKDLCGGGPAPLPKIRECLKCDAKFKSLNNMRICRNCKISMKNIEEVGCY